MKFQDFWRPKIYLNINQNQWLFKKNYETYLLQIVSLKNLNVHGIILDISSSNLKLIDRIIEINLEENLWKYGTMSIVFRIDLGSGGISDEFIARISKHFYLEVQNLFIFVTADDVKSLASYNNNILKLLNFNQISQVLVEFKNHENFDWKAWFDFKVSVNFNEKLKTNLKVNKMFIQQKDRRWLAEDVRMLSINIHEFNESFKSTILCFRARANVSFLLEMDLDSCDKCRSIINKIHETSKLHKPGPFIDDHLECLSLPMQPLHYNLIEDEYKTFELDPVKYKLYQEAIRKALVDRVKDKNSTVTTIMILGAGRGPLVQAAYYAGRAANCKVEIIVVEKNPLPKRSLESTIRRLKFAGASITTFYQDMRELKVQEELKADIFVSELLGSFGDNELCPECLDGAEKFLKDDGISIPCSYSSYIQPISSWRLYNNLKDDLDYYEQPWVVNLRNSYAIDDTKELWSFQHPMRMRKDVSNYRCETVKFVAKEDSVLHGIAGYFSTQLYADIEFNIVPSTHTKGLISWWPMIFPSKKMKFLKKGDVIEVNFERKIIPNEKIWYQWRVDNDEPSNVDGKINPFYLNLGD